MDYQKINTLWEEHLTYPFPEISNSKIVDGGDLLDIDSATAGCVISFLESNKRMLSNDKLKLLKECTEELKNSINHLYGYEKEYFERLFTISAGIIKFLEKRNY